MPPTFLSEKAIMWVDKCDKPLHILRFLLPGIWLDAKLLFILNIGFH